MVRPSLPPGTRPAHGTRQVDLGNNESYSIGIGHHPHQEGTPYLALTGTQSKWFKTFKGAEKWLAKRGYDAHGNRIR
jgi:hypothetical protein